MLKVKKSNFKAKRSLPPQINREYLAGYWLRQYRGVFNEDILRRFNEIRNK